MCRWSEAVRFRRAQFGGSLFGGQMGVCLGALDGCPNTRPEGVALGPADIEPDAQNSALPEVLC